MHKVAIRRPKNYGVTILVDGVQCERVLEADIRIRVNQTIDLVVTQHDDQLRTVITTYPIKQLTILDTTED